MISTWVPHVISLMGPTDSEDIASAAVSPNETETHVFKTTKTYALSRLNIMLNDEAFNTENVAFILSIDHLKKL